MTAPVRPGPLPPSSSFPCNPPGNSILRFWRGGYSLPFSYWVVGLLLNLASIGLSFAFSWAIRADTYAPQTIALSLFGLWASLFAVLVYQSVGVWRSASRYAAAHPGWRRTWAVLAQLSVLVGVGHFAWQYTTVGSRQLDESWRMAFQNDPDIPDFTMRVMRGGSEMEIAGGFKFGLSRDAARLMDANPNLKVIHLNSVGGRIGEARQLAGLIRERGLITYTATSCASACTLAFVAGRERFLKQGGRLGFHGAAFAGIDNPGAMRALLLQAGIEPGFVEKAAAQPTSGMWYPSPSELTAAHVLTGVVDGRRFAASGFGVDPKPFVFENDLLADGMYRAIDKADPALFQSLVGLYRSAYGDGRSEGEIRDRLQAEIGPVIRAHIAAAADDILVGFANLLADEYTALGAKDARACFQLITRGETREITALLDVELREREQSLSERALRSRHQRLPPQDDLVRADLAVVVKRLERNFAPEDLQMFNHPGEVPPTKYDTYCRMTALLFRNVASLPPLRAGDVMSAQFKSMNETGLPQGRAK